MSASNTFETAWLQHLFQNAAIANIGDATGLRGSSAAGNFYIALYTADPGEAGTATTNEATFTGYARVAIARSSGGFTVVANSVSNAAATTFAACTAGTNTITHFGIVTSSSGAGDLIASGVLDAPVVISTGNPVASFAIGQMTSTVD